MKAANVSKTTSSSCHFKFVPANEIFQELLWHFKFKAKALGIFQLTFHNTTYGIQTKIQGKNHFPCQFLVWYEFEYYTGLTT